MPSVIPRIRAALQPTLYFLLDPEFEKLLDDPAVANFAFGNPQELPLAELVSALQEALQPEDRNWFAYKMNEVPSRRVDGLPDRATGGHLLHDGPVAAGRRPGNSRSGCDVRVFWSCRAPWSRSRAGSGSR